MALRIRIEIEKPAAGSYNPAAFLKVISRHGRTFNNVIPRYIVTGEADVIDIGILAGNLAHSREDQNEGFANVNIVYDGLTEGAPQTPVTIKRVSVGTTRAMDLSETLVKPKIIGKVEKSGSLW